MEKRLWDIAKLGWLKCSVNIWELKKDDHKIQGYCKNNSNLYFWQTSVAKTRKFRLLAISVYSHTHTHACLCQIALIPEDMSCNKAKLQTSELKLISAKQLIHYSLSRLQMHLRHESRRVPETRKHKSQGENCIRYTSVALSNSLQGFLKLPTLTKLP